MLKSKLPSKLPSKWRKPLLFGFYGALGCLLGALPGEAWLALTRPAPSATPPPRPAQAVALVVDTSGSMWPFKLGEVKDAAKAFIARQRFPRDRAAVIGFGSSVQLTAPLGNDPARLQNALDDLDYNGATRIDLGLEEGARQVESQQKIRRWLLLFTDGMPGDVVVDAPALALEAARKVRERGVRIVAIATGDADRQYLAQITGDPKLVFWAGSGDFGAAFDRAGSVIYGYQLAESAPVDNLGIVAALRRIGVWTGFLSLGIALALLIGQAFYLRRPLSPSLLGAAAGGWIVGVAAGAAGQILFAAAGASLAVAGRMLSWALLGGVLARGTALFVPNLQARRAFWCGAIGGALAAGAFVIAAGAGSDIAARLGGATILGFFVGLLVAWAEVTWRRAWLDVRGRGEIFYQINLGGDPIRAGSDRVRCAIWTPEGAPIFGQFTLRDGRVFWRGESAAERALADGEQVPCGMVTVTVRQPAEYSAAPIANVATQPNSLAGTPVSPVPTPFSPVPFSPMLPVAPPPIWSWTVREGTIEHDLSSRAITTVGRTTDNDVALRDESVSSRHARFECENEKLSVFDLDSTNGTFVNDARLAPHVGRVLQEGDVVRLGQTRLTATRRAATTPSSPHSASG